MALIEVSKLSRSFQRGKETITALDNITLEIPRGGFVALTGPSGSGKSTLMYTLGLLDRSTSGTYILNSRSTSTLHEKELSRIRNQEIGFIFQSFHLLPRASALRNVMVPLVYGAAYGVHLSQDQMKQRAINSLTKVGLGERLNHSANELSGGQCQRVAIARALINQPSVLFADEPTGNLDSKTGMEILSLLEELNASGVTILLVTHDPKIAAVATRKIKMVDGKITEDSHVSP